MQSDIKDLFPNGKEQESCTATERLASFSYFPTNQFFSLHPKERHYGSAPDYND